MRRLPLLAFFLLVGVAGLIGYAAGLTQGARRWRARADSASAWVDLQARTGRYLDTCVDAHAECKAACPVKLGPVGWDK